MTKPVTRVVNKRKEPYDVDICRPSKWSNPFTHLPLHRTRARWQVKTRADSIFLYELWVRRNEKLMGELHELAGKTLGCVCKPKSCHGDVLVRLVEETRA